MNICYFGSYEPWYSRNRIMIKGLKRNGIGVFECRARGIFYIRYWKLLKKFLKLKNKIENIIVGFPGWYDIPLAFVVGKVFKKKIIFDIFFSTYETYVIDRKVVRKNSLKSLFYFLLDWFNLTMADYILTDTNSHSEYFQKLFRKKSNKFITVRVGSDDDIFFPKKLHLRNDVLFYGSFQPLHGVDVILKAAKILPETNFKIIGDGQTKKNALIFAKRNKLSNVEFKGWISLRELALEINSSKIILGIFSKSTKASNVLPNKIYDAIACKKPVITLKTAAAIELLKSGNNAVFVENSIASEIAEKIVFLSRAREKREQISNEGYRLYAQYLRPQFVVKPFLNKIYAGN